MNVWLLNLVLYFQFHMETSRERRQPLVKPQHSCEAWNRIMFNTSFIRLSLQDGGVKRMWCNMNIRQHESLF